jgi:hydroxypyruvate isomerase
MGTIKQAAAWWCFVPGKLSPEALAKTAADIGYDALELVDEKHWQMVKDAGLKLASHRGHESLTDGFNRRENRDRIEKDIRANLELAIKWNIPNLICFSGNRNGISDEQGAEITADNLRHVAKLAEDAGVTLILELLNSKVDHPDYQCDRTPWGVQVMEAVNSPRVKLLYDIYHMQIMEGDVIRTIQTYHQHIGHYHTAGNPGRHEIDDTQELNYAAIFRVIASTGYSGYITHEFIPTGDPATGLKAAFDLCAQSG